MAKENEPDPLSLKDWVANEKAGDRGPSSSYHGDSYFSPSTNTTETVSNGVIDIIDVPEITDISALPEVIDIIDVPEIKLSDLED